ncbi:response regulator [Persicimonas caeni]|uniref:histidine kinase n=1 Tax=Persicimonas caeni TaxID=2292766 RepID=A0A4Y6PX51_PERCE|nr:ATP-binding protein [Persicimonas caeni]QDG52902.1 response regulator [Persicimonas caeni]QED34124.1 response regulator [Persicimonas caeni]
MPHGHCYLWEPALVWIQLLSNLAIGFAYVAIAITLVYLIRRIEDLPFKLVYVCFAIFIITCGFTHFMDAYVIWNPVYWLDGGLRIVTAIASVGTAVLLPPLVPDILALARGARAAHRRGVRLESMVDELETLYAQTKELERQKTAFFANVSHELRTPLQLILGPAQKLVASDDLGDEDRERAETIVRSGRTLLKHVNDLLDIASLEAGQLELSYAQVDLSAYTRQLIANFETLAEEQAIDMSVEVAEGLEAQLDPEKYESIVLNLLSNALKFTPEGGTVRCSLSSVDAGAGRHMVFTVADSGPGVPAEQREAIFERFRQLDHGATRRFGGTGLGLVVTRSFAELHNGKVRVDDAPEGGARFTAELPMTAPDGTHVEPRPARAPATDSKADRERAELTAAATDAERRARQPSSEHSTAEVVQATQHDTDNEAPLVLVVEDNHDMSEFVARTLQADYRVASAYDGKTGLEAALELQPDLIISDIMMPEMSGDELVRAVRGEPKLASVPILLLTAKADDELRVELLRSGAQDYVMKPFETEELLARVDNQVSIARTRKVLQSELESTQRDLEALVGELAANRRELERSLQTTRVALEKAERASQVKSNFLRLVSHELRTPVAALQLQLAVLQEDDSLGETSRKMVERMGSSMERLTRLIDSLLQRTSIESGNLVTNYAQVDPSELVADLVDEMAPDAHRRGLELRFEPSPEASSVYTDPHLLELILSNLIGNALRYTDEGLVEIGVVEEDREYRFWVSDTGPGIAPEDRVRLFEPFERGDESRERQLPGAGLGLALVRDMTEALGGRIELDSEVGTGSTFTVVLPSEHASESSEVENDD